MKKNKIKALVLAAALFIFAVLTALDLLPFGKTKYDVVFFGDSLVGNDRHESSVTSQLESLSGMSVYNAGIGGTTLTVTGDDVWNRYSMLELSKCIKNGDFTECVEAIPGYYIKQNAVLEYASDTIKGIADTDYKAVKVIVFEQGISDYLAGIPIENPDDDHDETTFAGTLNVIIDNLKTGAPNAEIIVVSPLFSYTDGNYSDECNTGYGTLPDYVEAERRVCGKQNVKFIDACSESGIDHDNYEEYMYDGLHTNEAGNRILAELINKKLSE